MKSRSTTRLLISTISAVSLVLLGVGCQGSNTDSVAGSTGPGAQTGARASGVGVGGHPAATSNSAVGPTGAGPAGSQ